MKLVDSSDLRLYQNWLHHAGNDLDLSSNPIPLPFGSNLSLENHNVYFHNTQEDLEVWANEKSGEQKVRLYPPYAAIDVINHPDLGDIELSIFCINAEADRQILQSIIARMHYLSASARGLLLGCRFQSTDDQKNLLQAAQEKQTMVDERYRSSAWTDPMGRVIGGATLDALTFGVPKGRDAFAGDILGNPSWREDLARAEKERREEDREAKEGELTRSGLVKQLRLAWASRFALDAPYTGLGIGSLLAKHLKIVAAKYRIPYAERIEVIRTVERERAEELLDESSDSNDFLTMAGYEPVLSMYSRPKWMLDPDTGLNLPPAKQADNPVYEKIYYLAEL